MAGAPGAPKVGFAGTPEFARVALDAVHAAGFQVPLVLTQPDRPAGRGLKLQASAVKQFAAAQGMPVLQPRSLRLDGKFPQDAAAAREVLQAAALDVLVVAAYGLILPPWVLELPRRGCLNIHASLLPRWRGAAPIHRAIEAGDHETGITIMQMDAGLDTGAMLLREEVAIGADDTTAGLHDRLAALGGTLIVSALRQLDGLTPAPQPAEGVSYARKIEKAEGVVAWDLPADLIERRVRAFDPFPGCSFVLAGETVKLWRAQVVAGQGVPGTVLEAAEHRLVVACGEGALSLLELQRTGARRVAVADFLRGHPVAAGAVLGRPPG
jgi:methionyl-tRNA formyltransferase